MSSDYYVLYHECQLKELDNEEIYRITKVIEQAIADGLFIAVFLKEIYRFGSVLVYSGYKTAAEHGQEVNHFGRSAKVVDPLELKLKLQL